MRYVIAGYRGMMGAEVDRVAREKNWERLDAPEDLPRWTDPFDTGRSEPDVANPAFGEWIRSVSPDVVLNAAALVGSHKVDALGYELAWRSNVATAGLLAEAADACGAVLVHFSSDSVFAFGADGYGLERRIVPGETPVRPRTLYGWTKWIGECVARAAIRDSKLLVLYPSFGFGGPNDGISMISAMIRGAVGLEGYRRVLLPLDLERVKQPTWHADIGRFVVRAVERGVRGTYPVAGSTAIPYGEVVDLVRRVTGAEEFFRDRLDVIPALDYKGDDLYDARSVERAWDLVEAQPTSLNVAIRSELERVKIDDDVRRHVVRLLEDTLLRAGRLEFAPWGARVIR